MIHKAFQITFEALGKEHTVYSEFFDSNDEKLMEESIKKIAPTAHITNICTSVVSEEEFNAKSLENLYSWIEKTEQYGNEEMNEHE